MTLAACMFTNTPDGHFIIDQHPTMPQISYASPCSGHGYKFASVLGEIMAELAELGATRWDISLFRADRFGVPTSALFRNKGVAPRVAITGHHDPFGNKGAANGAAAGRGARGGNGHGAHDASQSPHWLRDGVKSFW